MKTKDRCRTSNPTAQGRTRPTENRVVPVVLKRDLLVGPLMPLKSRADVLFLGKGEGMRWTKEVPTRDGWYWFRDAQWRKAPDLRGALIVRVVINERLGALFCDGRLPRSVDSWPGEWAGPITIPEED